MASDQINFSDIQLADGATDVALTTPATSIAGEPDHPTRLESHAPEAGHNYIIQAVSCGRRLTLLHGEVVLAPPESHGSQHWTCAENNGWLGFRNVASNNFVGHDAKEPGGIRCISPVPTLYERVHVRPRQMMDVGYSMLMEYYEGLRPIGTRMDHGVEKLDRILTDGAHGIEWCFIKVS